MPARLKLLDAAREASEFAHAPYSNFKVGAAILTTTNQIITGCNVECSSYPLGICAEQAAIGKAIADGWKGEDLVCVAVWTADGGCWPCGGCRQVLAEFNVEMEVIVESLTGAKESLKLAELLPKTFKLKRFK